MLKKLVRLEKAKVNNAFKKWILTASVLSIMSPLSYADKVNIFVTGGPTFTRLNNENYVDINQFVTNKYQTQTNTVWEGVGGVGIAHTFENILNRPLDISLGVAGYWFNLGHIQGTEYPFINDDIYDTLNYKFKVESGAVMVESRWLYSCCHCWQPFALIGLGASWNRLSAYNELPTDPALSAAPVPIGYGNHTETSFAYEFGAGVQHELYDDVSHRLRYSASLDYRYVNLGEGKLSPYPAITTGQSIKVNNIYTQAITLTISAGLY